MSEGDAIIQRYRVRPGSRVDLWALDCADTGGLTKEQAAEATAVDVTALAALQEALYVAGTHGLLIVLQGMDASGKDGTVRHVFSAVNPLGTRAYSFKAPTPLELAHDYLWRIHQVAPARGEIVVFNRSHYESVLAERVLGIVPVEVWSRRYQQINEFEAMLDSEGVRILKFHLAISQEEQERRLLERIRRPDKRWKVNTSDWTDRARWPAYMDAYTDMLERTSTDHAPWYLVPADAKWFRNYVVAHIVTHHLEALWHGWQEATLRLGEERLGALPPELRETLLQRAATEESQ
jgi:PPK2 family polyphosphate:nucleotide phosphotransferase